jgi:pyruvate formate lyase activating enzyme
MRKDSAELPERKALIFNVQKYNMYDGPGVRTLIFFKGCPLRCLWCSNPEGMKGGYQIIVKSGNCVNCGACVPVCPQGIHSINSAGLHRAGRDRDCTGCGACVDACLNSALSVSGERRGISELMDVILEDKPFYDYSGGGVTLGGGEATMQPQAAVSLLAACKRQGIHTAVETCGYAKQEILLRFAEYTDLFLYDVKHIDPEEHLKYTGARNEIILENLEILLRRRYAVRVRAPLLRGINSGESAVKGLCDFLAPYGDSKNFKGIDLLPYHRLGVGKYSQLDMEYRLRGDPVLGDGELESIESYIRGRGIGVSLIRH